MNLSTGKARVRCLLLPAFLQENVHMLLHFLLTGYGFILLLELLNEATISLLLFNAHKIAVFERGTNLGHHGGARKPLQLDIFSRALLHFTNDTLSDDLGLLTYGDGACCNYLLVLFGSESVHAGADYAGFSVLPPTLSRKVLVADFSHVGLIN